MPKLTLKYSIKPNIVFQKFGESQACYRASDKDVIGKVNNTCPAGYVDLYQASGMLGHNGIDMYGPTGTPIYYAGPDGFVEEVETDENRGLGLGIITDEKYEFDGGLYHAKTRYWHMLRFTVNKGDKVKTGQLIGYADNTGYSSGSHLHFELKAVLKNSKGVWYNVNQNSGYYGACDPSPYFDGTYAQDVKLFLIDLEIGMKHPDVKKLQETLFDLGYFTYFKTREECTDFYGRETMKAVLKFQWENKLINIWQYFYYGGRYCYDKTRSRLNEIIKNKL